LVGRIGAVLGVCRSGWDWLGLWRFRIGFWDAVNADDIANADVLGLENWRYENTYPEFFNS
jgi:hypothetical protein